MGFEPTTFCMASRRSSQLSYSRAVADSSFAPAVPAAPNKFGQSRSMVASGRSLPIPAHSLEEFAVRRSCFSSEASV
jgi:hypothetical protein